MPGPGCPSEDHLVEFLEGLLAADAAAEVELHIDGCRGCARLLAAYGSATVDRAAADPSLLLRGDQVGRYLVLDFLGAGGMGLVYAAYDPQLDRKVALKLIRFDALDETGRSVQQARLVREAQALARLNHPNTTTVYDVGREGARLFLAMEFVPGRDLAEWLRVKPRTTDEICAAFLLAGRGLAAAHAAGIVHRDFKPANVLVDDDGNIKVSDFGLARVLEREDSHESPMGRPVTDGAQSTTLSGAVVGTPGYLAPEQLRRDPVDARADQFAFCAALFEALYGRRPFAGDTIEALAERYRRGDPPDAPRVTAVAPRVRDAVLCGLALDPSARHPTMTPLLAALVPEPPRKYRSWAIAAASLLVPLSIWLGLRGTSSQARCERAGDDTAGLWSERVEESLGAAFARTGVPYAVTAARSVGELLRANVSALSAAQVASCDATRVRGSQSELAMDLRSACFLRLQRELATTIDVFRRADAALVGRALDVANDLTPIERCDDVEALRTRESPPPLVRRDVEALERQLARPEIELRAGHTRDAEPALAEAAARADALRYRPLQAHIALLQVALAKQRADHVLWRTAAERAVQAALAGRDDQALFDAYRAMAESALDAEGANAAEPWLHSAAAVAERLAVEPSVIAELRYCEAQVADRRGDAQEAYRLHRRALAEMEKARGEEHPALLAALNGLGVQALEVGRPQEARELAERAIHIAERAFGSAHVQTARAHLVHGYALAGLHEPASALAALALARPVLEREYGTEHEDLASLHEAMANAYDEQDRIDDAIAAYERAISMRRALRGPRDVTVAAGLYNLATTLNKAKRYEEALRRLDEAQPIYAAANSDSHVTVGVCNFERGRALQALGRHPEALAALERARVVLEAQLDDAAAIAEFRQLLARERRLATSR